MRLQSDQRTPCLTRVINAAGARARRASDIRVQPLGYFTSFLLLGALFLINAPRILIPLQDAREYVIVLPLPLADDPIAN